MNISLSYMDGISLGTAVLPDCLAIVDSPRCMMERSAMFDATHDWVAEVAGTGIYAKNRRLFAPNWYKERMVTGTGDILHRQMKLIAKRNPGKPILVFRHGLSLILNTDVDGVIEELRKTIESPLLPVSRESFDDDWVDGWRGAQMAWWNYLLHDEGDTRPQLVGFPLFRLEGDELGNVEEIKRMCRGAELPEPVVPALRENPLEPISVKAPKLIFSFGWRDQSSDSFAEFGGQNSDETPGLNSTDEGLQIKVPTPIGISATSRFLRLMASGFGKEESVEPFIQSETKRVMETLRPFIARTLAGRAAAVVGDPWSAEGLASALREMGVDVPLVLIMRQSNAEELGDLSFGPLSTEVLFNPNYYEARTRLKRGAELGLLDLVIGSGVMRDMAVQAGLGFVEVTAPHYFQHFAASNPYMGFEGVLRLGERVSNAILERDYMIGFTRK